MTKRLPFLLTSLLLFVLYSNTSISAKEKTIFKPFSWSGEKHYKVKAKNRIKIKNENWDNGNDAEIKDDNENEDNDNNAEIKDDNENANNAGEINKITKQSDTIEKLCSPFEDITEYSALVGDTAGMKKSLSEISKLTPIIDSNFSKKDSREINKSIRKMNFYFSRKKYVKLATQAMNAYKRIITKINWGMSFPNELAQLDYVGFRMKIYVKKKQSWNEISRLVLLAVKEWNAIRNKVNDKPLVDTEDKIIEGLKKGAETRNYELIDFAADMQLNVVDLLENFFVK